jgi:hypothetical protein
VEEAIGTSASQAPADAAYDRRAVHGVRALACGATSDPSALRQERIAGAPDRLGSDYHGHLLPNRVVSVARSNAGMGDLVLDYFRDQRFAIHFDERAGKADSPSRIDAESKRSDRAA